eukprot:CAMPEP_0119037982 /NCGR_PEP_ID=MMETSP1177-20130426/6600_1 /TAXON_ID=2985 /ORGANISM="Ochromonas sp, Strain CCMP1899" /LENGTH=45 /DNA_ID= /DNA_START= /DNA_END= /DNA_ORIENTATION=
MILQHGGLGNCPCITTPNSLIAAAEVHSSGTSHVGISPSLLVIFL